jgi:hypothetical protein
MIPLRLTFVSALRFGAILLTASPLRGADESPRMTAKEVAAKVSAAHIGSSIVRLRMEIQGSEKETLQLQIKERRSTESVEVAYEVLWPKERKGETIVLRKTGDRAAAGFQFTPPEKVRTLKDLSEPLLQSDLALADVIEDVFSWGQQTIVGTEDISGVSCQILESKPGRGETSIYDKARTWVDLRRFVPLKIEKYAGGKVLRTIETTKVVTESGRHIPANLLVRGPRAASSTLLDGSRIRRDVTLSGRDFSIEGLKDLESK